MGLRAGADLDELWRGFRSLAAADARQAFVHTLRTIVDPGGQRVNASDRLYLAAHVPTLIVWGERDRMIPVAHGRAAHAAIPGSRLEVFPDSGHFPHRDRPRRFVEVLVDFIESTAPAQMDATSWRASLRAGGTSPVDDMPPEPRRRTDGSTLYRPSSVAVVGGQGSGHVLVFRAPVR